MTDDELREVLKRATKGPWKATETNFDFTIHPASVRAGYQGRVADVIYWSTNHGGHSWNPSRDQAAANAALIALAPTLAARVLSDAEKIAKLKEALREIAAGHWTDNLSGDVSKWPTTIAETALAELD